MRSLCCLPHYIPIAASLNISYDIKRKVSEAAAEVRSNAQLDHVLFRQCKRVADWLRFKSSYMRLADWLRVESSDKKIRAHEYCLCYRSGNSNSILMNVRTSNPDSLQFSNCTTKDGSSAGWRDVVTGATPNRPQHAV